MKRRDLLLVPAAALVVMIANVAISFGIVWVYSTVISPGQPLSHYQAFAETAAPIGSVVAGIPLMLLAGYLLARGRQRRAALLAAAAAALVYIVLDTAILVGAQAGGSSGRGPRSPTRPSCCPPSRARRFGGPAEARPVRPGPPRHRGGLGRWRRHDHGGVRFGQSVFIDLKRVRA